jgi:hypothetical protein
MGFTHLSEAANRGRQATPPLSPRHRLPDELSSFQWAPRAPSLPPIPSTSERVAADFTGGVERVTRAVMLYCTA